METKTTTYWKSPEMLNRVEWVCVKVLNENDVEKEIKREVFKSKQDAKKFLESYTYTWSD